jgi:hypothetical protein
MMAAVEIASATAPVRTTLMSESAQAAGIFQLSPTSWLICWARKW